MLLYFPRLFLFFFFFLFFWFMFTEAEESSENQGGPGRTWKHLSCNVEGCEEMVASFPDHSQILSEFFFHSCEIKSGNGLGTR